ncbi:hypothetical protein [Luteimonas huabeiensis]|uniref:hypothetical protein n=1 Tax=Luteimonas huabeiensis TaxID=1244513 RepID=UPI00046559CC|nr:hypothetical protein [Luteimonas huabeiensis]
MIEAIQVAALDVAAHTGPAGAAMAPQQAGAIDVRDFAQALQRTGGASGPDAAAAPQAVQDPAKAEPSEGARMMISAFDSLNSGAKNIEALSKAMSGTQDLTPSQVLEMTMKCHEFLFQSQLTSNVANRTSDGVQQLFRQQS